jgi:hypothetical protein
MIPFQNALPYETIQNDLYLNECPFCQAENIIIPIKRKELQAIQEGCKRLLVFPCCHHKITIINADSDYLLANKPFGKK